MILQIKRPGHFHIRYERKKEKKKYAPHFHMQHKVICMGAHASPAKYQQLWTVLPWTGLQVSIKALDCIWWYSGRRGVKKELCATNYQWLLPCWNLVLKAARQGGLDSSLPTFKHIPISTPLSLNITVFIFLFICRTEEENREFSHKVILSTDDLKCNRKGLEAFYQ